MRRSTAAVLLVLCSAAVLPVSGWAHCQVPCGIYDDPARVGQLYEDTTTIAKAIAQINELSGRHDVQSINQVARWVATKEQHASHIITTMSEYFLAQRVKPVAADAEGHDGYLRKLAEHHQVIVAAMKAKQNCEASFTTALREAIDKIAGYYSK